MRNGYLDIPYSERILIEERNCIAKANKRYRTKYLTLRKAVREFVAKNNLTIDSELAKLIGLKNV